MKRLVLFALVGGGIGAGVALARSDSTSDVTASEPDLKTAAVSGAAAGGFVGLVLDRRARRRRKIALGALGDGLAWLDRHINLEATAGRIEGLSLERMRKLVEFLGDPQQSYPVIHITGTNGKGSTARMITGLLAEAGLMVGT